MRKNTPRNIATSHLTLMAALALSGCPDTTDTTESTASDPAPEPMQKLVCNDPANTILCWNETTCQGTPGNFCAAHIDGDVLKGNKYPNAQFNGTCADPPEYPKAKCGCDYGVQPDEEYCQYDEEPTTGDPTTSDPPGPGQWLCTIHSQTKCVEYNYSVDPLQTNFKDCWVDPNQPDNVQQCVFAEDLEGARAACKQECDKILTNVTANIAAYNPNNDPDFEIVSPPIDCTLDDVPLGDEPMPLGGGYQCAPKYNALVAWGGSTVLKSMQATVALATSGGGSTGYGDTLGYIGYSVSGCDGKTCKVTIDAIETVKNDVPGIFTDAAGAQTSYLLEDVDLHLVQEVHGILYESRGMVVFPTESFVGAITVGDAIIGGASLGPWETTQVLTQASGSISRAGELTLNLTVNVGGGVFTMAITTH